MKLQLPQFALALASPVLPVVLGCTPDFQLGYKLSISNGYGIEIVPRTLTPGSSLVAQATNEAFGEFEVVRNGSSGQYVFRASSSLAIAATGDRTLSLAAQTSPGTSNQKFTIDCNACNLDGTVNAAGCRIKSVSAGRCVHYVGEEGGEVILMGCNPNAGGQLWRFGVAATRV